LASLLGVGVADWRLCAIVGVEVRASAGAIARGWDREFVDVVLWVGLVGAWERKGSLRRLTEGACICWEVEKIDMEAYTGAVQV